MFIISTDSCAFTFTSSGLTYCPVVFHQPLNHSAARAVCECLPEDNGPMTLAMFPTKEDIDLAHSTLRLSLTYALIDVFIGLLMVKLHTTHETNSFMNVAICKSNRNILIYIFFPEIVQNKL